MRRIPQKETNFGARIASARSDLANLGASDTDFPKWEIHFHPARVARM